MSTGGESDRLGRRTFLGQAVWLGAAAVAQTGSGTGMQWLRSLVPVAQRAEPFEFEETSVTALQDAMASGRLTARSITEHYLQRIGELDRKGPALSSIIETNPEAADVADQLDRERTGKGPRGPLHGIPVILKDNIDTADRMITTAGSLALEGSIPPRDSRVAERLRAAGAVLLAKANLSEWANIRSTHSTSGWSARGGQCRNPYALDRNPCGSSSGSAVAVSANLGPIAVGTETDGSIVCPASTTGIVGIKPTVGLVSRAGIIPISHTQDTAGPLCRTVADAAVLLTAMAGPDPRDGATKASAGQVHDYTKFLDLSGLRGMRIGVARAKFFGYSDATDRVAEEALELLRREGAILVDPADVPHAGEYDDAELDVLLYEFKTDLARYLEQLGPKAPVKNLADVIQFNEQHRDREMPFFGQDLFLQAQKKGPLSSSGYQKALQKCRKLSRSLGIDAVMNRHKLNALVAPTGNPAWPTDLVNGDHFTGGSSTPAAVAGYPSVSVPMGFVHGLPVNLSFFGKAWSEPTLIRIGYAYEQASKHRKPPSFAASVTFAPA